MAGLIRNTPRGVVRVPPPVLARRAVPLPLAGQHENRNWQVDRAGVYVRRSGDECKVDNLRYYRGGGLGSILTRNGCSYRCAHCVEPDAKSTRFGRREVESVVDEMQSLTAQGILDLHTTDSEFNPSVSHAKNVLREIVRRKHADAANPLNDLRLWVYCQPSPFDEELADLLAAAGCRGVNVGTDHVRADLLSTWKVTEKGTIYLHVRRHGEAGPPLPRTRHADHGRGPARHAGETDASMRECVQAFLALDATVTGFSLGLRLFPCTPLGIALAQQCNGVRTVPGLQSDTATSAWSATSPPTCRRRPTRSPTPPAAGRGPLTSYGNSSIRPTTTA